MRCSFRCERRPLTAWKIPLTIRTTACPRVQVSKVARLTYPFKVGEHVSWNSEAGRVSGTIVRVHTRDFDVNGYTHHASAEAPQYEIKSSKTEHIAFHKGSALSKIRD